MLSSWKKRLTRKSSINNRRLASRIFRPRLEALEDRTVPSQFLVTSNLDDGSAGTLRWAIDQASAVAGADEIAFDTANLFATPQTISLNGNQLSITDSVDLRGPGADQLAVSGNHASRVFKISSGVTATFVSDISSGVTVSISGMTIKDGDAGSLLYGGGIYNAGALTVTNVAFSGNYAAFGGGGIFNGLAGAVYGPGGGIYHFGILSVTDSTFSGNSSSRNGGGIENLGDLTVTNSTFSGNSAVGEGGGLDNSNDGYGGVTMVSNSTFSANFANSGGGMAYVANDFGSAYLTVTNSTFAGNSASLGGGIFWSDGRFSPAFNYGGGLINVTIVDNRADYGYGGGISSDLVGTTSHLTVSNTIIARNTAMCGYGPDVAGEFVSNGYNLVGDDSFSYGAFVAAGDRVGTTASPIDPLLAPLGNYGGPTQTMALLPGSLALGAGSIALAVDASGNRLSTDQRGLARPVNGTVDIGAFENQVVVTAASANRATLAGEAAPINLGSFTDANSAAGPWNVTVSWGDATTNSSFQTSTQGNLGTLNHAYAAAGTYTVAVTVADANGDTNQGTFPVQVNPLISSDLQTLLTTASAVTFEASASVPQDTVIAAVNALTAPAQPVTITLNLNGGTYSGTTVSPPPNVTLVINGASGINTFVGHSPAFIITSGNVIVTNVTFTNSTDTPTILVSGGSLTLRNDTIQETTGGSQAAIAITGGTVDLGTTANPGGNILNVNGPGELIHNTSPIAVSAIGNTFEHDGAVLTSPYRIEDKIFHALDAGGGGLVTYIANNVYVTQSSGSIQRGVDAVGAGGTVNVETAVNSRFTVGAKLATVAFQNGPSLGLQADPLNPGQVMLAVSGTAGNDNIRIKTAEDDANSLKVKFTDRDMGNFRIKGAFSTPLSRIVVYGQAGNDDIKVDDDITIPAWLYGGDGNDRLKGGNGPNVLVGGAGDDLLVGGNGRDILIGDIGADRLIGNGGDDILIGGYTSYDALDAALAAIAAEWTSNHDFATRVANISDQMNSPGFANRLNGNYFLIDAGVGQTVFNDSSKDTLEGDAGRDWFFTGAADKLTDLSASDVDFQLTERQ